MMDFIESLTPLHYAIGALLIGVTGIVIWFQQKRNSYDFLDILLDATTGRASLDAHVTLFFCLLAAWYVIARTIDGEDVGATLVQIIAIMVLYRGAKQAITAYASRPADLSSGAVGPIDTQVNITRGEATGKPPSAIRRPTQ